MKNMNLRVLLSALCVASIFAGFTKVSASPIRYNEVVQIVNARPDKANGHLLDTGRFERLQQSFAVG